MKGRSMARAVSEMPNTAERETIVDLRSDTVTKPTAEMRRAMAEAEVGDDVYGEDPAVNKLQERAAQIFGREATLFVPSGTMGNQIAIKCWTHHGNEVICEEAGHIYNYEMAAMSALSGCIARVVRGQDGVLTWDMIEPQIRPKIYYRAQTGLISLENTHNMAGGIVYPQEIADEICHKAHERGIPVHLDGARIFNAAVARGKPVQELTSRFDSVMFCLSKGLAAPVGSMLVGSREFIEKARVYRKMFGGGMRQAGVLAAAGLIALEKMPQRLLKDHQNAKKLAEGLAAIRGIRIETKKVMTNIVIFDVKDTGKTAAQVSTALKERKILANPTSAYSLRMVTHLDVDESSIERALAAMREILRG